MRPLEHAHDATEAESPPSTGFLPLSLAIALFVSGLFVLGIIPGFSCQSVSSAPASSR